MYKQVHRGVGGHAANYDKLVRQAAGDEQDYLKLAYTGIKMLLGEVGKGKKVAMSTFIGKLGSIIEAEMKCIMFEAEYPAYFAVVEKSLEESDVASANHKQKVLMKKFQDFDLKWNSWTTQMKGQVGMRILKCILTVFDDLIYVYCDQQARKRVYLIDTTVAFDDWIAEFEKVRGLLYPARLPLKIPPMPWENNDRGAYYTSRMMIPFIKVKGKDAREFVSQTNPVHHKKAVNKMQSTAWAINKDVLKVQKEVFRRNLKIGIPSSKAEVGEPFPKNLASIDKQDLTDADREEITAWKMLRKRQYDRERKRKGQVIGYRQTFLLAKELVDWDKFHFAYNCDFRGRIYCATSGLSPQGSDAAKGLLRFQKGVKLRESGVKWLAIHGANVFGVDKVPYEDRVQWIKDNEDMIHAVVQDPIEHRQWADADKPYQFLSFCYEWARCDYGRDQHAVSYIPVGLDGSCNGLQHYSAMLRDAVGGKATNLMDSVSPEDIYQEVTAVLVKKLEVLAEEHDAFAKVWLQVGIDRKLAKKPVMTLPYGAKLLSARNHVFDWTVTNWARFNMQEDRQWEMAKWLTPLLWESIGEVVIAARQAMDWLRAQVSDEHISWLTILGFPVFQHYKTKNTVQIRTFLNGRKELQLSDMDVGDPSKNMQKNGVAPNFVHSVDSTHMVLTINASDFMAYAMIHDDFGTHAGHTQQLFTLIRKSFRYMYKKYDILEHWANQQGVTSHCLDRGQYNIEDILNAKYFFG